MLIYNIANTAKRGKMRKKGQAAMEFLMTYGWAILVVLVAIGALAYFGVLSPEKLLPEKCVIPTGTGLFCEDHAAVAGASVTLRIKNILNVPVNVTQIVIDPPCGAGGITPTQIATDSSENIFVPCVLLTEGKLKADVKITFTKEGGLEKTTTASLITTAA